MGQIMCEIRSNKPKPIRVIDHQSNAEINDLKKYIDDKFAYYENNIIKKKVNSESMITYDDSKELTKAYNL
jgi:hypothetical protein